MLLNSLDLIVCVSATAILLLYVNNGHESTLSEVLDVLLDTSLESTGFATCVLSVTRTICLCRPFYRINGKAIVVSTACFLGYLMVRELLWLVITPNVYVLMYLIFCNCTLIITVVIGSNVISARKLLKSKDEVGEGRITELNKKATITVLILSVLFCCFNLVYVSSVIIFLLRVDVPYTFHPFSSYIALPLNSALNPIVYLIRKHGMRVYVKELWERVITRTC